MLYDPQPLNNMVGGGGGGLRAQRDINNHKGQYPTNKSFEIVLFNSNYLNRLSISLSFRI